MNRVPSKKQIRASQVNGKAPVKEGRNPRGRPRGPQPWIALGITRQAWYLRQKKGTNVYNVTGQNARVNINSVDNSLNAVGNESLFADLRNAIGSVSDVQIRERSLKVVEELEAAKGSDSFVQKYKDLIQTLANHVSVIASLLPALTQLLH